MNQPQPRTARPAVGVGDEDVRVALARSLDPRLDMWRTAEPVVREWIERNLGPVGRLEDAGRGALSFAAMVGHLPRIAARAETLAQDLESDRKSTRLNSSHRT